MNGILSLFKKDYRAILIDNINGDILSSIYSVSKNNPLLMIDRFDTFVILRKHKESEYNQNKELSSIIRKANKRYKSNQFESAKDRYEHILTIKDSLEYDDALLFYKLGVSEYKLGNYESAFNYLRISRLLYSRVFTDLESLNTLYLKLKELLGDYLQLDEQVYLLLSKKDIINISMLKDLVSVSGDIEIDLNSLNINYQELLYLKILLARESMLSGYSSLASKLIKEVESYK